MCIALYSMTGDIEHLQKAINARSTLGANLAHVPQPQCNTLFRLALSDEA